MNRFFILLLVFFSFSCKNVKHQDTDQLELTGLEQPSKLFVINGVLIIFMPKINTTCFLRRGTLQQKIGFSSLNMAKTSNRNRFRNTWRKGTKRDIGTRLFKFRGNMSTEMDYYHEDGIEIITAYTNGVNGLY